MQGWIGISTGLADLANSATISGNGSISTIAKFVFNYLVEILAQSQGSPLKSNLFVDLGYIPSFLLLNEVI